MTDRLYWPSWFLAALLTGIVGGFMLGHALILAQFLNWLVLSGVPALSQAYPAFRGSAGQSGLGTYYAVAGLQVIGTSAFLLVSLATRRHRTAGLVAGVAGALWIAIHYASGFGALEGSVLGAGGRPDAAVRFLAGTSHSCFSRRELSRGVGRAAFGAPGGAASERVRMGGGER
jgi:hypothetical protein